MTKKRKKEKKTAFRDFEGFGPKDAKRLSTAVRKVWSWSFSWRQAKKRALGKDGFYRCENPKCKNKGKPVPHVAVDHIFPIGEVCAIKGGKYRVRPGYLERVFVHSSKLRCLCNVCHREKTNRENKARRSVKTAKPLSFY